MESRIKVLQIPEISKEQKGLIKLENTPCLLKDWDIGSCTAKWNGAYLTDKVGDQPVNIHVSSTHLLDFLNKNFKYETVPFSELIKKCDKSPSIEEEQYCYLRTVGVDVRKDVADFSKQFPSLADDLKIPSLFPEDRFFSSVLRVSSPGTQLWTHYDIMDNILIQVTGRKRCVLFPPTDAPNIYLSGDKSKVLDIDNPDLQVFPNFAKVSWHECTMEAGDILYIPALWFHNMRALDFGVAVNVFWKDLDPQFYDKKDLYGNKDLVPAADALRQLDRALKSVERLPEKYREFYKYRMLSRLQNSMSQHK